MSDVIGVDGCAGGWIAASRDSRGAITCTRVNNLAQLFNAAHRPRVIAIDVPIGLLERGARVCDVEARRLGLRPGVVFPAPIRPVLAAASHAEASAIRRRVEGKGMSIQTWAIVPKIVEVDAFLRSDRVRREIIREVHPEVSFFFLNGQRPLRWGKKRADGQRERKDLLLSWAGDTVLDACEGRRRMGCAPDDIIDAIVALWTAERIVSGNATSIPAEPPLDAHSLRMEMMA